MPTERRRAVFLDRDGVLIEEVDYLGDPRGLRLIPSAPAALRRLSRAGFRVIVISNQSGVARGYFSLSALRRIHARLRAELRARGARLDAIYYCPHHPDDGCRCRKPETELLARAGRRFGLDLGRSFFIGDTSVDVRTARRAGCAPLLVRTGYGGRDRRFRDKPLKTFKDVGAAAAWILREAR